jgi:hypothetical protein
MVSLQEDVAEMKKKEAQNEKLMTEIAQENKRLSEPLQKALKEVEMQRHQLANYEKDKTSLHLTKMRLADTDKQLKNLEWYAPNCDSRERVKHGHARVKHSHDRVKHSHESMKHRFGDWCCSTPLGM